MIATLMIICLLAALCLLGHGVDRALAARDLKEHPAPGVMVPVKGKGMHVLAQGQGERVVLLSGWGTAVPSVDYQPLATALHNSGFSTAIVEKFGYGYSDWTKVTRDIDTVVEEMRAALAGAQITPPYVLCGHSLAGTELVRWSCLHPEEVSALCMIDAPAPLCYTHVPLPPRLGLYLQRFLRWSGLNRLMMCLPKYANGFYKYVDDFRLLTPAQKERYHAMQCRNAANPCCCGEILALPENARKAGGKLPPHLPVLMFIASDTVQRMWKELQPEEEQFMSENQATRVDVEGLHNLQHFDPAGMAQQLAAFLPHTRAV